jgi:hypothetical protein
VCPSFPADVYLEGRPRSFLEEGVNGRASQKVRTGGFPRKLDGLADRPADDVAPPGYDTAYRLVNFEEGALNVAKDDIPGCDYSQQWELDGLGNWTTFTDDGTSEAWDHNAVNEITKITVGGTSYEPLWDDNGSLADADGYLLTDENQYNFEFDALNRLIKVTRNSDSAVLGEYAYDSLNRRVWRKADEDRSGGEGGQETELLYLYDGWRVLEERDYSREDLVRDYAYGNYIDEVVYGRADFWDGTDPGPDGDFNDDEEQFYYTTNNLYNVTALLGTSGNIIERYEYLPYGEVTVYVDDGGDGDWSDGDAKEAR